MIRSKTTPEKVHKTGHGEKAKGKGKGQKEGVAKKPAAKAAKAAPKASPKAGASKAAPKASPKAGASKAAPKRKASGEQDEFSDGRPRMREGKSDNTAAKARRRERADRAWAGLKGEDLPGFQVPGQLQGKISFTQSDPSGVGASIGVVLYSESFYVCKPVPPDSWPATCNFLKACGFACLVCFFWDSYMFMPFHPNTDLIINLAWQVDGKGGVTIPWTTSIPGAWQHAQHVAGWSGAAWFCGWIWVAKIAGMMTVPCQCVISWLIADRLVFLGAACGSI